MSKNELQKKGFNLSKLSGFTNSIRNTFDKEDDIYEDYIEEEVSDTDNSSQTRVMHKSKSADKTLHIFKPKNRDEDVAKIILQLREGSPCIINVSELSEDESKRIIDNISGAAFALMGSGVPVDKGIYAFAPKSFSVNSSDSANNKQDNLLTKVSN